MNSELRVLFISWAFAPDSEIGAKRITRFSSYLPPYGIKPVVLTVQERFLEHVDRNFFPPSGVRVERTTMLRNPLRLYSWLKNQFSSHNPTDGSALEFHPKSNRLETGRWSPRNLILHLLSLPDQYQGWYFPAVWAGTRLIHEENINAIFSSGPPFTCHLVALYLRKKHGIPWVADFRDPWVLSRADEGAVPWVLKIHSKMEASCLKHADLVICNTDALRHSFLRRYPQSNPAKFVTLTNGYDDAVKPPPALRPISARKLFLHHGSIYGLRRIDTFCQAARNLVDSSKLDPSTFSILFHGDIDAYSLASARKHASSLIENRTIRFEPFVESWQDAQEVLWAADILLIFSAGSIIVPAKFYEYLKTGKPILAIAEKGALTDLVDLTGSGAWADPHDSVGIATALLKVMQMAPIPPEDVAKQWDPQFHFRSLTAKLANCFQELTAKSEPNMH